MELEKLRADPVQDLFILQQNERLTGYAIVEPEINIGRAVIGIGLDTAAVDTNNGGPLLERAVARAVELGAAAAHVALRQRQEKYKPLLRNHRFRHLHRYWRMTLENPDNVAYQPPKLPAGYSIRSFRAGEDEALLNTLQNAVFTGSWGYSPNTLDETKAQLALPGIEPGGILILENAEGKAVGYNWTRIENQADGRRTGRIHMTGIHPDWRRRRLSGPIVIAGIAHLVSRNVTSVALDVDSSNRAAVYLYRKLGFEKVSEIDWYERQLP